MLRNSWSEEVAMAWPQRSVAHCKDYKSSCWRKPPFMAESQRYLEAGFEFEQAEVVTFFPVLV